MTDFPMTACPECKTPWPEVSEQGVSISLLGRCWACAMRDIAARARQRETTAGYRVEPCKPCWPRRLKDCTTCSGRGFVALPLNPPGA